MSRNIVRDTIESRVYGAHEQRLEHAEKLTDGEWVYVGTYPTDANTTPDSPVFKNGWSSVSNEPVRFRWLLDGNPDIRGKWTGGADDTVVFTLPTKVRPDNPFTVPHTANNNCVGSYTVEADGDVVWHEPCGGGPGGTLEELVLAKSSLRGWWRLGENPNEADLETLEFRFANSAPGYANRPMVVSTYQSFGGSLAIGVNGDGSSTLGDDDGCVAGYGVGTGGFGQLSQIIGVNTGSTYSDIFTANLPWTIMCWFLPGFESLTGDLTAFDQEALVAGSWDMDQAGSLNEGIGWTWRPYEGDPDSEGPRLRFHRWGSGGEHGGNATTINVPLTHSMFYYSVDSGGQSGGGWWANHGFNVPPSLILPGVKMPGGGGTPWMHLAATYDGTNVRSYVDGLLHATELSTFMAGIPTEIRIMSAYHDVGVSESPQYLRGAVDEVIVWNEALTGGEILDIAQA